MGLPFAVSIVIPLMNQNDSWLGQCIRSALDQTVATQVVVVTSPHTASSNQAVLQRLQAERSRLVIRRQTGRGFANAVNLGFSVSESSRVGLLLSDDWLLPTTVEMCLRHETDIVSTSLAGFAADGQTPLESVSVDLNRSAFESLPSLERRANYLSHFFLFRKAKVEEVGGLDESLGDAPGIDDYDFIWTLLEHNASTAIVEERLYCYRDHCQDRLTLRPAPEQVATLSKILAKHGVTGLGRESILRSHGRWFGRPIHMVRAEPAAK